MRYALFALALLISFAPLTTHAAFEFVQIVPAECKCDSVPVEGGGSIATTASAPAYGCVLQTIQNVIRVGIALSIAVATLALIYAGFVWMTSGGNPERRNQGSHLLMNVFVGIFVILGAWLLVDFVMKSLAGEQTGGFGPWNNILGPNGQSGNNCIVARNPSPIATGTLELELDSSGNTTGVSTSGSMNDQQARAALAAGGVEIANWPATRTLANTRNDTINQTVEIKRACNCSVIVTATTGGTHAAGAQSHSAGYKVDLEDLSDLNRFLESRLRRSGSRGNDPRYLDSCGNEYVREGSHWDITVSNGVCRLN